MSLVLDASVLVAALTDLGRAGRWAEELLVSDQLIAPALLQVETMSVLRRLEAAGKLSPQDARSAAREMLLLQVALFPFEPLAERVWALRTNLTSYDAWYVALAEAFQAPLATLDRKLARSTGPRCEFLLPG